MKTPFRIGSQCARSLTQKIQLATMRRRLIALLILIVLAGTVTFSTTSYARQLVGKLIQKKRPAPTLTVDKGTYLPGEKITLAGTNWVPGEGVTIIITSDTSRDRTTLQTVANKSGSFTVATTMPDPRASKSEERLSVRKGVVDDDKADVDESGRTFTASA